MWFFGGVGVHLTNVQNVDTQMISFNDFYLQFTGGKMSWRSNIFALDCREAEAMPANNWRPPKFMPPEKLIILTDGTCGSTCASFTKIPQEAGKATFVGAGGLWKESMDVSSFAGRFGGLCLCVHVLCMILLCFFECLYRCLVI